MDIYKDLLHIYAYIFVNSVSQIQLAILTDSAVHKIIYFTL